MGMYIASDDVLNHFLRLSSISRHYSSYVRVMLSQCSGNSVR